MNSSSGIDALRTMRLRAGEHLRKHPVRYCAAILLVNALSFVFQFVLLQIGNPYLYAFTAFVLAMLGATFSIGQADFFLRVTRGEETPSFGVLFNYFDAASIKMVLFITVIRFAASLSGLFLGMFSLVLDFLVPVLLFLVPYLYVHSQGTLAPMECFKQSYRAMNGRWGMYVRILVRIGLYSFALGIVLSLLSLILPSGSTLILYGLQQSNPAQFLLVYSAILVVFASPLMAYLSIYESEFANETLEADPQLSPPASEE